MKKLLLPLTAAFAISATGSAFAATINDSFNAQITIVAECKIKQLDDLNFGSVGVLDNPVTATANLNIQCSNGVGYTMSFSNTAPVQNVSDTMVNGGEDVAYTAALSASSGTGNGNQQTYTISGNVPAQTTPSVGTYTDTQTIYVTY